MQKTLFQNFHQILSPEKYSRNTHKHENHFSPNGKHKKSIFGNYFFNFFQKSLVAEKFSDRKTFSQSEMSDEVEGVPFDQMKVSEKNALSRKKLFSLR